MCARPSLRRRRVPASVSLILLAIGAAGLSGVGCKGDSKRGAAPAGSAASSATPAQGAQALREAIAGRARGELARVSALGTAARTKAASTAAGRCDARVTAIIGAELVALTALTDLRAESPDWRSPRLRLLEGALGAVERAGRVPGRSPEDAAEVARRAQQLAAIPETRYDFQLLVEERLDPTVRGQEYTPGFLKGTLLAYDRVAEAVVCAARVAGANRADAIGRLGLRGGGFAPELKTDEEIEAPLIDDLIGTTLFGAQEKLVAMAPAPR